MTNMLKITSKKATSLYSKPTEKEIRINKAENLIKVKENK